MSLHGRDILRNVSADFEGGSVYAVMGPSGAGKTTLLRLIGMDFPPDSGVVQNSCTRSEIAWIPQSAPVIARRSVVDNVAIGALATGSDRQHAVRIATQAIRSIGLGGMGSRRVLTLSGGERQRVAVARALAGGTRLLLADEPTASLDASSRDTVVAAMRALADEGAIVIVATHDRAVAEQTAQVLTIEDGQVTCV